jgi:hypothetical protein
MNIVALLVCGILMLLLWSIGIVWSLNQLFYLNLAYSWENLAAVAILQSMLRLKIKNLSS